MCSVLCEERNGPELNGGVDMNTELEVGEAVVSNFIPTKAASAADAAPPFC